MQSHIHNSLYKNIPSIYGEGAIIECESSSWAIPFWSKPFFYGFFDWFSNPIELFHLAPKKEQSRYFIETSRYLHRWISCQDYGQNRVNQYLWVIIDIKSPVRQFLKSASNVQPDNWRSWSLRIIIGIVTYSLRPPIGLQRCRERKQTTKN